MLYFPGSDVGLIVGMVICFLVLVVAVVGGTLYYRRSHTKGQSVHVLCTLNRKTHSNSTFIKL